MAFRRITKSELRRRVAGLQRATASRSLVDPIKRDSIFTKAVLGVLPKEKADRYLGMLDNGKIFLCEFVKGNFFLVFPDNFLTLAERVALQAEFDKIYSGSRKLLPHSDFIKNFSRRK